MALLMALTLGGDGDVRAVVSDLRMPGFSGLDLLALLKCASHPAPVILLSAYHDAASRAEARALGALAVVDKPIDPDVLGSLVARAVRLIRCRPDSPGGCKRYRRL